MFRYLTNKQYVLRYCSLHYRYVTIKIMNEINHDDSSRKLDKRNLFLYYDQRFNDIDVFLMKTFNLYVSFLNRLNCVSSYL